jgi:hypothetical protein
MKLTINSAQRIKTGTPEILSLRVPPWYRKQYSAYLKKCGPDAEFTVVLDKYRLRSTGDLSQNHHINGHLMQICADDSEGEDFELLKMRMKFRAIKRGYPVITMKMPIEQVPLVIQAADLNNIPVDNEGNAVVTWPKSESDINTVEAGYLIDEIHQYAAEKNIELIEADKQSKYICHLCHDNRTEHRHHLFSDTKDSRRLYGKKLLDSEFNLIPVCSVCHLNKPIPKLSEREFCEKAGVEVRSK